MNVRIHSSKQRTHRRNFSFALASSLLAIGFSLGLPKVATADVSYPNKAVRLIVAYAPGGSTDMIARLFAQGLSKHLGQNFIVENRAGGGTLVGTESVVLSQADGYTLLLGTPATVITPMLHRNKTYDVLKDLQAVSLTTSQVQGVTMSPTLGVNSIPELIKYAKANPGKVNFASTGNGSAGHLAAEALSDAAGIKMLHIPYKGTGTVLADLVAGRVHLMMTSLVPTTLEHVKHGRLKLIATTGASRSKATPDVPTVAEGGLPGFTIQTWTGLFAPAGTPKSVIGRLNQAMEAIQREGTIQKAIESQAIDVAISSPEEMHELLKKERGFYSNIIERTNAKID